MQINTALLIANILLVILTGYYAYETHRLAKNTAKQAKAHLLQQVYYEIIKPAMDAIKNIKGYIMENHYGFNVTIENNKIRFTDPKNSYINIQLGKLDDPILTITGDDKLDKYLQQLKKQVENYRSCLNSLYSYLGKAAYKLLNDHEYIGLLDMIQEEYKELKIAEITTIILNNITPSNARYENYINLWKRYGETIKDIARKTIAKELNQIKQYETLCLNELHNIEGTINIIRKYLRKEYSIPA